jgi:serine/threonine protein kinase
MTPERHERIQQIFEAAVELPPAERGKYLLQACAGDDELRRRIERLMEADDQAPAALQSVKVCPVCARCYDGAMAYCPADSERLEIALHGPLLIDGKYRIERRLGHGGMGAVYQVRHTGLEKTFALKLILAERAVLDWYRKSFETEARALGRLKHPNIVGVTDYGIDPREGGVPYLVMEYLHGQPLRQYLKKRGRMDFAEAAPMLREIASAIDFAHSQNIIHADLKPGNLFLADGMVKVVDFGLARFPSAKAGAAAAVGMDGISTDAETVTMGASLAGTPPYMAPELFRNDAPSKPSDRFAFGVIAYEMLTGALAYGNEGCRSGRFHDPPAAPSSRSQLPAELDGPLLALLDPIPEHRPATAMAAVDQMEAGWLAARQRQWKLREVPRRMIFAAATAAGAVLIAALTAQMPIAKTVEERTVDARLAMIPAHAPDPRLMIVAIDDASLARDPRPLAEWSAPFSRAIEHVFAAGARSVAIDVLLPAAWAASSEFTSTVMHHAGQLTLAMESHNRAVIGQECIALPTAYILGPDRFSNLFGFVNLEEDEDRAIRRARVAFPPASPTFAARALHSNVVSAEPFWIDYSAPPREIPSVSFMDVESASPAKLRDRIIFIGATYSGSGDEWPIPSTISRAKIPGVVLQAEIANTIASNFPLHAVALPSVLVFMGAAAFLAAALALRYPHAPWISLIVAGAVAAGYAFAAFAASRWLDRIMAIIAPELAILLAAAAALVLARRLAPYPGNER